MSWQRIPPTTVGLDLHMATPSTFEFEKTKRRPFYQLAFLESTTLSASLPIVRVD